MTWLFGRRRLLVGLVVALISFIWYKVWLTSPYPAAPLVVTGLGVVSGNERVSRSGRIFYEYLGLPYALPPKGLRRYEAPLPFNESWTGVRDGTRYGDMCIQIDPVTWRVDGDENCLFLNVFTPGLDPAKAYPVLVFIYGGLFTFGHSSVYPANYFLDEDVILITFNYRVNSFGFLNTGDGVVSGNMGLKDQAQALRWIQGNIASFGGDPGSVTLFGESAGGASVQLQLLSPGSKGLFQRAITASGMATMPWTFYSRPKEQAERFAGRVGCPEGEGMVACLKDKPAKDLAMSHLEIYDKLKPSVAVFLPTAETPGDGGDAFITRNPKDVLDSGGFNTDVELLAGVNDAEGLLILAYLVANETVERELCSNWEHTLPLLLPGLDELAPTPKVLEEIKSFYNLSGLGERMTWKNLADFSTLLSDWWWWNGFKDGVRPHGNGGVATYLYINSWETQFSFFKVFSAVRRDFHPALEVGWVLLRDYLGKKLFGVEPAREFSGSCHGDEMPLLFPINYVAYVGQGHPDYEFSKEMIRLFTQFARSGGQELEWFGRKWDKGPRYMRLHDRGNSGMVEDPFGHRLEFWKALNYWGK